MSPETARGLERTQVDAMRAEADLRHKTSIGRREKGVGTSPTRQARWTCDEHMGYEKSGSPSPEIHAPGAQAKGHEMNSSGTLYHTLWGQESWQSIPLCAGLSCVVSGHGAGEEGQMMVDAKRRVESREHMYVPSSLVSPSESWLTQDQIQAKEYIDRSGAVTSNTERKGHELVCSGMCTVLLRTLDVCASAQADDSPKSQWMMMMMMMYAVYVSMAREAHQGFALESSAIYTDVGLHKSLDNMRAPEHGLPNSIGRDDPLPLLVVSTSAYNACQTFGGHYQPRSLLAQFPDVAGDHRLCQSMRDFPQHWHGARWRWAMLWDEASAMLFEIRQTGSYLKKLVVL
ncbi:hypothetical protein C8Q76DRAFT_689278 [Earliella scabrosa]|nr:hypothetical protein C8Q76DRAFT_689278 [Earliella scabrosa]